MTKRYNQMTAKNPPVLPENILKNIPVYISDENQVELLNVVLLRCRGLVSLLINDGHVGSLNAFTSDHDSIMATLEALEAQLEQGEAILDHNVVVEAEVKALEVEV